MEIVAEAGRDANDRMVAPVKNRNRMVQALGQNFVSHRQFAGGKWWGKSGGKAERKYK